MTKNGQPKFNIGDQIVVLESGFVSEVVKIYQLGGEWYYQLKDLKNLYYEKNLQTLSEFEKQNQKSEKIHVQYKFHFGDVVRVQSYGQDLFIVIGFRAEIWRYQDSAWEDIIYELSRLSDGAWLEAPEEELIYITSGENALKLINAKKQARPKSLLSAPPKEIKEKKQALNIDTLLDMYNDYHYLYLNFGESSYKKKMNEILKKLEALTKNPFHKHDPKNKL